MRAPPKNASAPNCLSSSNQSPEVLQHLGHRNSTTVVVGYRVLCNNKNLRAEVLDLRGFRMSELRTVKEAP